MMAEVLVTVLLFVWLFGVAHYSTRPTGARRKR